jgi:hypothetical protein
MTATAQDSIVALKEKNAFRLRHNITDSEELMDEIHEALSEIMADFEPAVSVENDGIGAYEYWGAKGYDAGTDYLLIEGNEDGAAILHVRLTDIDENPFEFAKSLTGAIDVTSEARYGDDEYHDGISEEMHVHTTTSLEMTRTEHYDFEKKCKEQVYSYSLVIEAEWCNCDNSLI